MLESLAGLPEVGAGWFSEADLLHLEGIVDLADVIVLARCKYSVRFARLVARARAQGKRVWFDIDDLVFDTKYVLTVLNHLGHATADQDMDYWFADFGRYGALLKLCDGVIVTNEFLGDRAREFSGLPTAILPNFMNRAQLTYSAAVRECKAASGYRRDGRVHLGYFSGSPTHQRDFEVMEPALYTLLEEEPQTVFRLVGQLVLSKRLARFSDRIEVFPMQNILSLQRLIGEVEINLVPLRNNVFTNCKSELKFFESAAVGTVTIATPTFAFELAITDGVTGFLAAAQDWRTTLDKGLLALADYSTIASAASAVALSRYAPEHHGHAVATLLFDEKLISRPH